MLLWSWHTGATRPWLEPRRHTVWVLASDRRILPDRSVVVAATRASHAPFLPIDLPIDPVVLPSDLVLVLEQQEGARQSQSVGQAP